MWLRYRSGECRDVGVLIAGMNVATRGETRKDKSARWGTTYKGEKGVKEIFSVPMKGKRGWG